MSAFPWESGTLYIAVDPAQLRSGFAYSGFNSKGERVRGVLRVDDIRYASEVESRFVIIASGLDFSKVVLAIEYPKWNAGASQTVRGAANVYIRLFKSIFPRIMEVRKIDPNEWQKSFNYRGRPTGQTTKDYSFWLATQAYGWWEVMTSDEADAAMLLEYARITPPTPRKKPVKKK
jgi:hypothetical protein